MKEVTSEDGGTVYIVPDSFVVVYAQNSESLERYKEKMDKNYISRLLGEHYQKQESFDFPDQFENNKKYYLQRSY